MHGQMGHPGGRGPPIGWRPLGASGVGPPSQAGSTPYGSPAGPRGGPVAGVPQMVSSELPLEHSSYVSLYNTIAQF